MTTQSPQLISERLELSLDQNISGLRRDVRWITVVGLVLFGLFLGYFNWVAGIIHKEMNPKDLAKVCGAYLSDFIVSNLKGYSENLIKVAPDYAGNAIDTGFLHLQEWLKDGRFLVIGLIDERLSHAQKLLTGLLDFSYDQHISELKPLIGNLKSEEGRKAFEEYFATLLAAPLASESVRIDIESLHLTLESLHERMVTLNHPDNLNPQETAERDLLLAFREFWNRYQKMEN